MYLINITMDGAILLSLMVLHYWLGVQLVKISLQRARKIFWEDLGTTSLPW